MSSTTKELRGEISSAVKELTEGQARIENKLDAVYKHTVKITEGITSANMKIDKISDDVEFLKHKEHQIEEDLFKLKKNLQIIK
jgi:outer membrane murein-binding lipoprotein Lpp